MNGIRRPDAGRDGNYEFSNRRAGLGVRAVESERTDVFPHNHQKQWNLDDWIGEIARTWKHRPQDTLDLARLLQQARQSLEHGLWSRLWRDKRRPFSKRKAEMLVVIGEGLRGLNANKCAHLPSVWRTLYCIAQLGGTLTLQLIAQGRIHPRLRLQDARELLAEFFPERARRRLEVPSLNRRIASFSKFVLAYASLWSVRDRQLVYTKLNRLLTAVSQKPNNSNPKSYEHLPKPRYCANFRPNAAVGCTP